MAEHNLPAVTPGCDTQLMPGGMYGKKGPGIPIGVRAGIPETPDARPWETFNEPKTVQPHQHHVLADIAGEWHEALALELRQAGGDWQVHIAWVIPGHDYAHQEWLPMERIRPMVK